MLEWKDCAFESILEDEIHRAVISAKFLKKEMNIDALCITKKLILFVCLNIILGKERA